MADATPIRLGQEFSGYARQIELGIERIKAASWGLEELALGGTAVGTGINTHPEFPSRTIKTISRITELPFREAANHFEAQAAKDAVGSSKWELKNIGGQPHQGSQRPALACLGAEVRYRRDRPAGYTASILHHAR